MYQGDMMKNICQKFAALPAIAFAVIGLSAQAQAAVINFEELPHDQELQSVGDVVLSKGYQLTYAPAPDEPHPVGFQVVGPSWAFNGRSAALVANSCGATITMTAQDNKPFTLMSIDLAGLNGDANVAVAFTGTTINGATVQRVVNLTNQGNWQRIPFPPRFRNLLSVTWLQGDCITNFPHMFDNISVFPR